MDSIGKKLLHAFFGVIIGGGSGWYTGLPDNALICAIVGAVIGAILAFCFTDKFWEEFKNHF